MLTQNQLLNLLIDEIKSAGSQEVFAFKHNMDKSYLCNILKGRRSIPASLAAILGFRQIAMYERKQDDA